MRNLFSISLAAIVVAAFCLPVLAEEAKMDPKALYGTKCSPCHGVDGVAKAMGKGSRNFNDPAFTMSTEEIVKITSEGKGKMPKFEGKLKPEDMAAIAAHVKTLAPKQ